MEGAVPSSSLIPVKKWEDIKPIFLHLYVDQKKTLGQVREVLRTRHQFTASKSAFTRQITIWNAQKNLKASDARRLKLLRMSGGRPTVNAHGQPVDWRRVQRATKDLVTLPVQPIDYNGQVVRHVFDVWHRSTIQFAARNPATAIYQKDFDLYHDLMREMDRITMSDRSSFPRSAAEQVSAAVPELIKSQPAMACELLISLIREGSTEQLKGSLFNHLRNMACKLLRDGDPFKQLLLVFANREAYVHLGLAIAKAKLDAMWSTSTKEIRKRHHRRVFFRQVVSRAILVILNFEDFEYANVYLREMSKSDEQVEADNNEPIVSEETVLCSSRTNQDVEPQPP